MGLFDGDTDGSISSPMFNLGMGDGGLFGGLSSGKLNSTLSDPVFLAGLQILSNSMVKRPLTQQISPFQGVPEILAAAGQKQQQQAQAKSLMDAMGKIDAGAAGGGNAPPMAAPSAGLGMGAPADSKPLAALPAPSGISPDDDAAIRTIVREAGSQSDTGKLAVAHVIANRVKSGSYGDTPADVVTAPLQFSPWNKENQGTGADPRLVDPNSPGYQKAAAIWQAAKTGSAPDPTGGALNFANPNLTQSPWVRQMMNSGNFIRIGDHIFGTSGSAGGRKADQRVDNGAQAPIQVASADPNFVPQFGSSMTAGADPLARGGLLGSAAGASLGPLSPDTPLPAPQPSAGPRVAGPAQAIQPSAPAAAPPPAVVQQGMQQAADSGNKTAQALWQRYAQTENPADFVRASNFTRQMASSKAAPAPQDGPQAALAPAMNIPAPSSTSPPPLDPSAALVAASRQVQPDAPPVGRDRFTGQPVAMNRDGTSADVAPESSTNPNLYSAPRPDPASLPPPRQTSPVASPAAPAPDNGVPQGLPDASARVQVYRAAQNKALGLSLLPGLSAQQAAGARAKADAYGKAADDLASQMKDAANVTRMATRQELITSGKGADEYGNWQIGADGKLTSVADKSDSFRPATAADLVKFNRPSSELGQWQINETKGQIVPIGGPQTSVTINNKGETAEATKRGEEAGSRAAVAEAAAASAPAQIAKLNLLEDMFGRMKSGKLAPYEATGGAWAKAFGIDPAAIGLNPDTPIVGEAAQKIINELTVGSIGKGGFPANNFSNADRDFLSKIYPSIANQPEANTIAIEVQRRLALRNQDFGDQWGSYQDQMEKEGKPASFSKFERQYRQQLNKDGQNLFGDLADVISKKQAAPAAPAPDVKSVTDDFSQVPEGARYRVNGRVYRKVGGKGVLEK